MCLPGFLWLFIGYFQTVFLLSLDDFFVLLIIFHFTDLPYLDAKLIWLGGFCSQDLFPVPNLRSWSLPNKLILNLFDIQFAMAYLSKNTKSIIFILFGRFWNLIICSGDFFCPYEWNKSTNPYFTWWNSRSSRLRSSPKFSPSLSASSNGGVVGGALSIQRAAIPTAVACHRNRLVVPMSGSFNASSRRMLMVMLVLDILPASWAQLSDATSWESLLRLQQFGSMPWFWASFPCLANCPRTFVSERSL